MLKYKVSAVSYLNTVPFIYGIKSSKIYEDIELQLNYPSMCAQKLINDEVDIALVPVVVLKSYSSFNIVSEYCISADGSVDTVCLYSNVSINEIDDIYLDYQSKTSVELLKILCKEYWKISPNLKNSKNGFEEKVKDNTAALIIGDRAFSANDKYKYVFDLSEIWKQMTGLPFVFACWISNKQIDKKFLYKFNQSLKLGIENIEESIRSESVNYSRCDNPKEYLNKKISYILDEDKRKSMEFFLKKVLK